MSTGTPSTIHASAVLVGSRAILIRGRSGAGKSQLALRLLHAQGSGALPFVRLIADDRVLLERVQDRVLVRPAPSLAGLIEIRGLGVLRLPYEPVALVGLVIDLDAAEPDRMPTDASFSTDVLGVTFPRIMATCAGDALRLLNARQLTGGLWDT